MSKLEKYLSKQLYSRFGQYSIRQNYRPDWLEGLELDFYIDEIKLAAEVQGEQHYKFIQHFHKSIENFELQKKRDEKKEYICREKGIKLFEIFTEKDADLFIKYIKDFSRPKKEYVPTYFYAEDELIDLSTRKKRKAAILNKSKKKQEVSKLRKQYQKEWQS